MYLINFAMKSIIMFKYLMLFVSFACATQLNGQSYDTAIGLRVGSDYGATIQQRITKKITVEGVYYGGFNEADVHANLLARRHFPIFTRRTNFYIGVGVGSHWIYDESNESFGAQQFTVPAVLGLEFTLGRLNISGDIMPHYVFNDGKPESLNSVAAISVRYVIKKKKPAKKLINKIEDKLPKKNKNKKKNKKSNKR